MNPTTPSTYDGTSTPVPGTPTPAGRGRGAPLTLPYANTKRGRKPTTRPGSATTSPLIPAQDFKVPTNSFYQSSTPSSWATTSSAAGPSSSTPTSATFSSSTTSGATGSGTGFPTVTTPGISGSTLSFLQNNPNPTTAQLQSRLQQLSMPGVDFAATATRSLNLSRASTPSLMPGGSALTGATGGGEEEGEDDELLPAMADDDYSAQLSWQSQSKDNLKYVYDIPGIHSRSYFTQGSSWIT
jgi:transcription initiation factor TFIID subunit 11